MLTGYDGFLGWDGLNVNDPSGYLFEDPDGDLVHVTVTWDDFFDAIDQSDWTADGILVHRADLFTIASGRKASIDRRRPISRRKCSL